MVVKVDVFEGKVVFIDVLFIDVCLFWEIMVYY